MAMEECGFHVDRVGMMNEVYSDDAAMEMMMMVEGVKERDWILQRFQS